MSSENSQIRNLLCKLTRVHTFKSRNTFFSDLKGNGYYHFFLFCQKVHHIFCNDLSVTIYNRLKIFRIKKNKSIRVVLSKTYLIKYALCSLKWVAIQLVGWEDFTLFFIEQLHFFMITIISHGYSTILENVWIFSF